MHGPWPSQKERCMRCGGSMWPVLTLSGHHMIKHEMYKCDQLTRYWSWPLLIFSTTCTTKLPPRHSFPPYCAVDGDTITRLEILVSQVLIWNLVFKLCQMLRWAPDYCTASIMQATSLACWWYLASHGSISTAIWETHGKGQNSSSLQRQTGHR